MSLLAMCMPILPGKKEAWLEAVKQLNSPEAKPAAKLYKRKCWCP